MHVVLRRPVLEGNLYAERPAVDPTGEKLVFDVQELRWVDEGGYLSAVIEATGQLQELQRLGEKLMYVVDVHDELGDLVWTGAIHSTEVSDGAMTTLRSMDEVRNYLRLVYMRVGSAAETVGTRTLTDWKQDYASVLRYGYHMLTLSAGKMTTTEADAYLQTELKRRAWPRKVVERRSDAVRCRLYCRGFAVYLQRAYISMPEGLEKNDANPDANQNLGEGSKIGYFAQKVALLAALPPHWAGMEPFTATTVVVRMRKNVEAGTGQPTDNVQLDVCQDSWGQCCASAVTPGLGNVAASNTSIKMAAKLPANSTFRLRDTESPYNIEVCYTTGEPVADGGQWTYTGVTRGSPSYAFYTDHMIVEVPAPGSVVAGGTATVAAANIPTYLSEVSFTGLSFQMSTTPLWLRFKRTASPNGSGEWLSLGYYILGGVKAKPYIRGNALIHYDANTGMEWRVPYPDDCQMWFKVAGQRDTYAQMLKMAVTASNWVSGGLVFTDYGVTQPTSGLTTIPYRNGELPLLDELTKLARRGTSDKRRVIFTMGPTRKIQIRPAPAETGAKYVLREDGSLMDPQGQPVRKSRGLVGVYYVADRDVETTRNAAAGSQAMYLKEYGYRPREDVIDLRSDNSPPAYQFANDIETG